MDKIRQTKEKEKMKLLRKRGAQGVGIGYKISDGEVTGEPSIVVGVKKKLPKSQLKSGDMVPKKIKGVRTDVVELGNIVAQEIDLQKRHRPAPCGVSIGHKDITAGTLGCLVEKDGKVFILSNNHVLANENYAKAGDVILQPGPYDGGILNRDELTKLYSFIPLDFGGEEDSEPEDPPPAPEPPYEPPEDPELPPPPKKKKKHWCPIVRVFTKSANAVAKTLGSSYVVKAEKFSMPNYVDAALAGPVAMALVNRGIIDIGRILGVHMDTPELLDFVQKTGRTTGYQNSKVFQIHATVNVGYSNGRTAVFEDQIIAGAMSAGGDSGSIVLNENKEVVGLLFAGSTSATIINPVKYVVDALKIDKFL